MKVFFRLLRYAGTHNAAVEESASYMKIDIVDLFIDKKVFYNPSQRFSCLDGSGIYPFHFVNDDYCDCTDGSDEPGTSACPNGLFYCFNLGHKPENIPSSRVNDGICDCCDTSDEYNSTADCFNTCNVAEDDPSSLCAGCLQNNPLYFRELGQHALEAALSFYKHFMQGHEIRETYIKAGKEKRDQYKVQLETLKNKENEALIQKLQKQEIPAVMCLTTVSQGISDDDDEVTEVLHCMNNAKKLIEIKEKCEDKENAYIGWQKEMKEAQEKKIAAERRRLMEQQQQEELEGKLAFKELDINGDGKLCTTELKSFIRFDYDHDGIVSDKEAMFFMHKKKEMTLEEFLSTGWKIVKPAFSIEQASDEVIDSEVESNEKRIDKASNSACNKREDCSVETSCKQASKIPVSSEESGGSASDLFDGDTKGRDTIFKEAAIARKEYAEAIKILQDIEAEKWNIKRKLTADFGMQDEFLALENECFELIDKRYLYRFCPFDKVVQLQRPSNSETLVGLWEKWSGPDGNIYSKMKFTRGNICWNGPNRSAEVNISCGTENKLLNAEELSPCTYLLEFITPAACQHLPSDVQETIDRGNIVMV